MIPSTPQEWLYRIFELVVIGGVFAIVFGILANLVTPVVKRRGENWLVNRRLANEKYRNIIHEKARQLENDPSKIYMEWALGALYGAAWLGFAISTWGLSTLVSTTTFEVLASEGKDIEMDMVIYFTLVLFSLLWTFMAVHNWTTVAGQIAAIQSVYQDRDKPKEETAPNMLE